MAGRMLLTAVVGLWVGYSSAPAPAETPPATAPASRPADQIVIVRIGDKLTITQADFERMVRLQPEQGYQVRNGVVMGMVADTLLELFMKEHPDWVTEQDIEARIAKDTKMLGFKTEEESRKDYEQQGGSWDNYRRQVRFMLARAKFSDRGQRLTFDEDKLKEIFQARREEYDGTMVKARQIFFHLPIFANSAERQAVRTKLERMREDILSGKRTWEQCNAESDSAHQGSDLGQFARHMYQPEPVAEAAFKLRDGQMTDVIETPLGYHLVQVLEYLPGKDQPWETVKQSMKLWLVDEEYYNALQEMRKKYTVVGVQEPLKPTAPPASRPARRPPPGMTHPAPTRKAVFAGDRPKTILYAPRGSGTRPAGSAPATGSPTAPKLKSPTTRPAHGKPTTLPAR